MSAKASTSQPVFPSAWTVPHWYVDPANASTHASDTNNCTTAVTPCRTYQQINVQRWGCLGNPSGCPRLRQDTTITWLSSQSDSTDPVYFQPTIENGAQITLEGTATTVASVVINGAGFHAKNRTTGQQLTANLTATGAVGQLLTNSTHPSQAWAYKSLGANAFVISQPLTAGTTEVDTWQSTDTVVEQTLSAVDLVAVRPIFNEFNGGFTNLLNITNMVVFDPGGAGIDPFDVGSAVQMSNVNTQRWVHIRDMDNTGEPTVWSNMAMDGALVQNFQNPLGINLVGLYGGYVTGANLGGIELIGLAVDDDLILTGAALGVSAANLIVGVVNLDNQTIVLTGASYMSGLSTLAFWGAGASSIVDVAGEGRLAYTLGAGQGAATFLNAGGVKLNNTTKGCLGNPNAATTTFTCNITTATGANLDTSLGGTVIGCVYQPGSAAFCNTGLN